MRSVALAVFLVLISCSTTPSYTSFGEEISSEGAVPINQLLSGEFGSEEIYKIEGVVEEVCQAKGCWVKIRTDQDRAVRVTFKDYGFFVPKDIAGRKIILEGAVSVKNLSEDLARHYADDAGEKYDESKLEEVSVVASGVLVEGSYE